MASPAPQYFFLTSAPWPLNWPEAGDRLLSLTFEELRAVDTSITGWSSGWTPATPDDSVAHHRFSVSGGTLTSQLCIIPLTAGGVHLAVRADGSLLSDQVLPWLGALERALPRLNEGEPMHEWWGAIMTRSSRSRPQRIGAAVHIGDMHLFPADSPYIEIVQGFTPTLGGGQFSAGWPVVVAGRSAGYSTPAANEAAARRLGILCTILSVALDACWEVAQAPMAGPLSPSNLPSSRGSVPNDSFGGFNQEPEIVNVPDWVPQGLEHTEAVPEVLSALRSHHQAMLLESNFPSFALLAYVAAIEGIGARYVPLSRCHSCSSMTGAGKRFRAALGLVLSPEDAKPLNALYGLRSSTAHQGRLHGGEELFGAFPGRMIPDAEPRIFRYGHLDSMRRASRDLLLLALRRQLPDHIDAEGSESGLP